MISFLKQKKTNLSIDSYIKSSNSSNRFPNGAIVIVIYNFFTKLSNQVHIVPTSYLNYIIFLLIVLYFGYFSFLNYFFNFFTYWIAGILCWKNGRLYSSHKVSIWFNSFDTSTYWTDISFSKHSINGACSDL